MLRILAARPPQTPKMQDLYAQLETDHKNGMKIMKALEDAELLRFLESSGENLKALSRTEKIYCDNPNLMYALCPDANVGTARESYFHNQVGMSHEVRYPRHGDFEVDGRFLFEVGGKGKSFEQIKDIPGSLGRSQTSPHTRTGDASALVGPPAVTVPAAATGDWPC